MIKAEQPLYPKISSIYNKIMQLGIAIVFIIVLMNLWLAAGSNDNKIVEQHFHKVSQQYLKQASLAVSLLLVNKNKTALEDYINELAQLPFVETVHLYDQRGKLVTSSVAQGSIKDLYGLTTGTVNLSEQFIPFVQEIRAEKLLGYLRLTVDKSYLDQSLHAANVDRQQLSRIMLLMAGLVGFLLTRGLSRFSRQGYRLPKSE